MSYVSINKIKSFFSKNSARFIHKNQNENIFQHDLTEKEVLHDGLFLSKNIKNCRDKMNTPSRGRKEKIPEAVRIAVWNNYIGRKKGEDKCFIGCGEPITRSNFECGHVKAEACGGKVTIQNLRPICSKCNKSIGKRDMEEFIQQYGFHKHKNWNKGLLDKKEKSLLCF